VNRQLRRLIPESLTHLDQWRVLGKLLLAQNIVRLKRIVMAIWPPDSDPQSGVVQSTNGPHNGLNDKMRSSGRSSISNIRGNDEPVSSRNERAIRGHDVGLNLEWR
jgi:hypothetical protein